MHLVLVNCLGGLSLPRNSVVRLSDRPDMTVAVYHGGKTTTTTMQCSQSVCCPNTPYNMELNDFRIIICLRKSEVTDERISVCNIIEK